MTIVVALLLAARGVAGEPPRRVTLDDPVPWGQQPVDYHAGEPNDAVARLNARLSSGEVALEFAEPHGYLPALLRELDVPVASQLLVFSKTALNPALVGPRRPRAVYFSDEVAVGWVPGAAALEVMALDPVRGAVFYTLTQSARERADAPRLLKREQRCLACHAGNSSLNVPGWLVRSFVTDDTGEPISGYSRVTHATAFEKRMGGWYVTGTHGRMSHQGNVFGDESLRRLRDDPSAFGNAQSLPATIDGSAYLSPHSDLVAHLVFQHQMHGLNLLIRAGQEARLGLKSDVEDLLVRYLQFADEPPLTDPVRGTADYRKAFEARGFRDAAGRSLRRLDLRDRLFEHRLSYLIDSTAFDGLPDEVRERLYRRLYDVLVAEVPPPPFDDLPVDERAEIIDIVAATKRSLPEFWKPLGACVSEACRMELHDLPFTQAIVVRNGF
ncbi:MAG: hypothetical protein KY476_08950 [Planctomycetes bacterium]|nr:hypothetical protein [Planctomycetota bacterium]